MTPDQVSRRARAAATAVSEELWRASGTALVRASLIAVPVVFVAAVVAGYLGISDAIAAGGPLATTVGVGALFAAYAAILGIVLWRTLGGARGNVLDVIAWVAREEQQRWTAASPGSRVPRSPKQARRWLAAHPETDANRPQRLAAALMAGDLTAARETLGRYAVGTVFERHQRAADGLALDLVAGRTVTADEIDAAYVELGAEYRTHAIACRAMTESFAAVLSHDDGQAPLGRARPGLPAEATGMGRRQAWLVLLAVYVAVSAVILATLIAAWIFIVR